MAYSSYQPNEDIKHPILNDIIFSQKGIRELYNNGQHWAAVQHFKTMASGLYFFTPELYEELDELIALIDKIERGSRSYIKGTVNHVINYNKERYRNYHAKMIFPELNRKLALILISAKFIQAPDNNSSYKVKPTSIHNKSGKRKTPREALTKSSSRAGEHKREK